MRYNIFFTALLALLLGFTSCEDFELDRTSVFTLITPAEGSISSPVSSPFGHKYNTDISGKNRSIEVTAEKWSKKYYFAVISTLDWNVVSCPEWITLTSESIGSTDNNFNKEVELLISSNSGIAREGSVVLSNGSINCMVNVKQAEGADKFSEEKNTICFNYDGGDIEYNISDISEYTPICDNNWLTATKNGNQLSIKCKENIDIRNRTANVIMSNGHSAYVVNVHQLSYPDGFWDGHAYVTLDGTSFSTCNLGASKPEDAGYLFAWGETHVKNNYSRATYKYYYGGYYTKYIGSGKTGELESNDDAATVAWGEKWCISGYTYPSIHTYYVLMNGVEGYIWEYNSKSIFMPYEGYWSSHYHNPSSNYSSGDNFDNQAYYFNSKGSWTEDNRFYGYHIRPIYNNK